MGKSYFLMKSEPNIWSISQQKKAGNKGVASNKSIRQKLIDLSLKEKFDPIFPPINLCSDNAAMIAMVGLEKYKLGLNDQLDFPARPRWPLDKNATFLKGAGVKL